jgi:beta-glucosidase
VSKTIPASAGARPTEVLKALTLEEKVLLLTGKDQWSTWPIDRVGLRRIVLSDGPSGVRGEVWDERDPSLNLPSATTLAASWDVSLARRFGAALGVEARRKGVDVVLGPTINLHRSPLGGRHFEAFSEDPVLTAGLAAAYVEGIQANGVAATPKHYVANDSETERFTLSARVSERALRELYLRAFESAVVEARAWLVMSAYNAVNDAAMTENELLDTPLKSEWCFDGVVVSDWTAVRTLESARHAQDLVMPGPEGPWGHALVDAVRSGAIDEQVVDDKVLRILRLAERVGALDDLPPVSPTSVEDGVRLAREVACEGMVMLENRGELPWDAASLRSLAVIGDNADNVRTQGGGSATVVPHCIVSPLAGLRTALPGVDVSHSRGAVVQHTVTELPLEEIRSPVSGENGVRVRFLDEDGAELFAEDRLSTALVWVGGDAPIRESAEFQIETRWTPRQTGTARLGFAAVGTGRLFVNGVKIVDRTIESIGLQDILASRLPREAATAEIRTERGRSLDVRFEFDMKSRSGPAHLFVVRLGTKPSQTDGDMLIAEAVEAAAGADAALVVVGTDPHVESEGFDRQTLVLPGRQDELVRAVASSNSHTVVLVNAGAPVLMPWRDEVAAVLIGWFGGQEIGAAVSSVLLGETEPGGRLPTTWPAREADAPVYSTTPIRGVLEYTEDIHLGYRGWLQRESEPAYWFGAGRGYADISLRDVRVDPKVAPDETFSVFVEAENHGSRRGKEVVQVYASRPESMVDRPVRWLVAFAPVRLGAGERTSVILTVPSRLLAYWDGGWRYEEGRYNLEVGTSAVNLPFSVQVSLRRAMPASGAS